MAAYNVEMRQRVGGVFGDTIYLKANWNHMDNKPTTFTATAHTHGNITNDGKIGSTATLPIITTTDGVLTVGSFGTAAGSFCQGNDSRLADVRNLAYVTSCPTAINSIGLKAYVGSTDCATKYAGWFYIIT